MSRLQQARAAYAQFDHSSAQTPSRSSIDEPDAPDDTDPADSHGDGASPPGVARRATDEEVADARGKAATARLRAARTEVARANVLASGMSPADARWVFALQVAQALEGGRAAILNPDRRRQLVRAATKLGFREFDANLLIAVVQDGRRSGRGALNPDVENRLAMVPEAVVHEPWLNNWPVMLVASLILGACITMVLAAMVTTGATP